MFVHSAWKASTSQQFLLQISLTSMQQIFYLYAKISISHSFVAIHHFLSLKTTWILCPKFFCTWKRINWCRIMVPSKTKNWTGINLKFYFVLRKWNTNNLTLINRNISANYLWQHIKWPDRKNRCCYGPSLDIIWRRSACSGG